MGHSFKTEGKVLVKPGWLAIWGKEAADEVADAKEGDKGQALVPVKPGEMVRTETVEPKGLKTRPPARYSEATLLGAMESAGKLVDDDELREAMSERGLGTPATRAAIIEGLITEDYLHRAGRDLVATAKAFSLMHLLDGLGVNELRQPEMTGDWEFQLKRMERGQLPRAFDEFLHVRAEAHSIERRKPSTQSQRTADKRRCGRHARRLPLLQRNNGWWAVAVEAVVSVAFWRCDSHRAQGAEAKQGWFPLRDSATRRSARIASQTLPIRLFRPTRRVGRGPAYLAALREAGALSPASRGRRT
jgi:hypothetical protein